ncbi:MAG: outer membrane beta-barrel protein [Flavobacteriaceae bacterium]
MNKNNIDKFFQEKFKDFEEVPDEKVWESIEASLDEKRKKRRIIPIWWRLGGVAALVAILFYIINPFESTTTPTVVGTDTQQVEQADTGEGEEGSEVLKTDTSDQEQEIEVVETTKEDENVLDNSEDVSNLGSSIARNDKEEPHGASTEEKANANLLNQAVSDQETIVSAGDQDQNPNKVFEDTVKSESVLVDEKETLPTPSNTRELANTEVDKSEENKPNGIIEKLPPENTEVQEAVAASDKKSIFDEIAQEEEEEVAENSKDRWSVGPSVAPVYFSSLGEGSPIHSNFVANSKTGNLNLSYGLSVSYELTKKLSVRSGIHKVDYGYDTNDVQFSSSLAASTNNRIDNIDYARASKNLVVQSSADSEAALTDSFAQSNEIAAPSPSRDGRMVQQFGYLEVPLELNYALVDKKVGVNIIGGVSSLFLVDNTVSLEADGGTTEIGEANNINSLNFSTNVGIGINYSLSPKMQLNLEPMFKYQLNTFSDTAGSFQPFSVGVYSGLSFKF